MTASKAKPVGRAVRDEPKVRVRKVRGFVEALRQDDFIVTGYTGSAKTLKRLAEIAGMDRDELISLVMKENPGETLEALGLSAAQARKGRK